MRTLRLLLALACVAGASFTRAAGPPGPGCRAGRAAPEVPTGPVVDRLREALDMPLDINFEDIDPKDMRLGPVLDLVQKQTKLQFLAPRAEDGEDAVKMKTFSMRGPLTVGAFLAFLEDHVNDERHAVTFIVREYGLRAVPPCRVPAGAMTLKEFRKPRPAGDAGQ